MEIDTLTASDLDAALALSRQAGWNQNATDWRRLIDCPQARAVAGRIDGEVVATTTTITYDERVSWIGMVLVDEHHRRRGYGRGIVERALADATADTIGLDATPAGRPLYRDLGFVESGLVERWSGVLDVSSAPGHVDRIGAGDRNWLAAYDEERCAVDRRSLLRTLLDEPRTTTFYCDRAGHRGYATLRPGREHWQLGPVVADSKAATRALLVAAAVELDGTPVLLDVVGDAMRELLAESALTATRTLTRMTLERSAPLRCGDGVQAAAGLELG